MIQLFRLQKYKKFESNSQLKKMLNKQRLCCFDCKSTKNLRAIHNLNSNQLGNTVLFRLQKYKKFESNSQPSRRHPRGWVVVSTAKVQKIWEQFTTLLCEGYVKQSCFDCKSTKNLRAIHNARENYDYQYRVVSTAKVQKIWEQFTTVYNLLLQHE